MKNTFLAFLALSCAGLAQATAFAAPATGRSARTQSNCEVIAAVATVANQMRENQKTYMNYVNNIDSSMLRQPQLKSLSMGMRRAGLLVFIGSPGATPEQSRGAIQRMCSEDPDYFHAR